MTAKKKSILFVHKTFPAQFGGFAKYLVKNGWDVKFLTLDAAAQHREFAKKVPDVDIHIAKPPRKGGGDGHLFLSRLNESIYLAQTYQIAAAHMAKAGFVPDVIMAHSGWGAGTYLPSIWPDAVFVPYLEWWYNFPARDVVNSAQNGRKPERRSYASTRNLLFMQDFPSADAVLCPTDFQSAEFPHWLKKMTYVLHDGVDCRMFSPGKPQTFDRAAAGIPDDAPIVTYATRGMEPLRGFPNFMAAASALQKRDPAVHIVVAGKDSVQYGKKKDAVSYKEQCLAAHEFDMDRLHFVGTLPFGDYRDLLRLSDVHIYLSEPFVLSWSLVHAMAVECALVVSDNAMLREALPDDTQARFVNDKAPDDIAAAVKEILDDTARRTSMGQQARKRALAMYDEDIIHPQKEDFLLGLLKAYSVST